MAIREIDGRCPTFDPSVFIETSAQVIGEVTLGARSSVWYNAVVRGDIHWIRLGLETNIQDLACLHVTHQHPVTLGDRVTVGHGAILHGCSVGDDCLIGMGAVVLDAVAIGSGSLIAAGSLVTPGTRIPPGSFVIGSPAKVQRQVNDEEKAAIANTAANYVRYIERFR